MHIIRLATPQDTSLIAKQRRLMFQDNQPDLVGTWEDLEASFAQWLQPRLEDGSYVGWIAEEDGNAIAGAGLWIMDFPPHWMDAQPHRGYLLNFYTSPEARGRGIAKQMVHLATETCAQRGIRVASLHASRFGRPIYEKLGFIQNNEMIKRLPL